MDSPRFPSVVHVEASNLSPVASHTRPRDGVILTWMTSRSDEISSAAVLIEASLLESDASGSGTRGRPGRLTPGQSGVLRVWGLAP